MPAIAELRRHFDPETVRTLHEGHPLCDARMLAAIHALLDLAEAAAMLRDATCVGWERRHGAGVPPLTLWLVRLPHIVASSVDDCNDVLDDVTAALKRLEEER